MAPFERLANADVLTGLANRAGWDRALQALLPPAKAKAAVRALMLFGRDGCRQVHDSYGL